MICLSLSELVMVFALGAFAGLMMGISVCTIALYRFSRKERGKWL